jgi:tetratricopeptide (TPR) repeat protein
MDGRSLRAAAVFGSAALIHVSCARDGMRECRALLQQQAFERAVETCGARYDRTADPAAGLAVAQAQDALHRDERVLDWQGRLQGTDEERTLLRLVAEAHGRKGDKAARQRAYEALADLADRAGDGAAAADAYHRLAYRAWETADYKSALVLGTRSLDRAESLGDGKRKAAALRAIFAVYYETGDLEAALAVLAEVEKLFEPDDHESRARHLANRAGVRLDEGRPELALQEAERALLLGRDVADRRFQRTARLNAAMACLRLGRTAPAAAHLDEAARQVDPGAAPPTSVGYVRARVRVAEGRYEEAIEAVDAALQSKPSAEWQWDLLFWKGAALEALGRRAAAARAYEASARVVEGMRASLDLSDLKGWLLARNREPYEALFRLQAHGGDARAALLTFERATARSFLDSFVGTPPAAGGLPVPERSTERVAALQELLPRMGASAVAALRPLDRLLKPSATRHVLAYFRAQQELWLLVVAGGRVRLVRLEASAAEASDLTERLVAALSRASGKRLGRAAADGSVGELAERLSRILLPPGTLPPPGTAVYLVTDAVLEQVPFALLPQQRRPLIERHPLTFVPSLNALAALVERAPRHGGRAVVLADPEGDLPAAAEEGREVAARLNVRPLLGREATRAALLGAGGARLLHVAAHAEISHRGPWLATADGPVGVDALSSPPLGPEVVVLATCVSAGARGRGMWGSLAAAFLASGSRRVVATVRSVEDRAARETIARFYAEGGERDPALALARAIRSLVREGRDPAAWTPFVHIGLAERLEAPVNGGNDEETR